MYVLLPNGIINDIVREREPIVRTFANRNLDRGASEAAGAVLIDAILERAIWSHPRDYKAAHGVAKKTERSLFWIGNGRIRQRIRKANGNIGWKEIDATASVRRLRRSQPSKI